jgi:NADH dehydrogenase FAD-containing subunit
MLAKLGLITSTLAYILEALYAEIRRQLRFAIIRRQVRSAINPPIRDRNIVVIGASFAGYHAASVLARGLPADSRYRVIVVEPHTHFHFTWVLPRFVVVPGHEHKAFVPYGGYVSKAPKDGLRWVKDWVDLVEEGQGERKGYVALRSSGERIPYDFLVVATGSGIKDGLPSRVNETEKFEGIKLMQEMQRGIREAQTIVVVGGGASGVEVATDAKCLHPAKRVVLVHSRNALMHRFGIRLQDAALQGCESLGVEVMLNDRVISHDPSTGLVTLKSGLTIHCDKYVSDT